MVRACLYISVGRNKAFTLFAKLRSLTDDFFHFNYLFTTFSSFLRNSGTTFRNKVRV